MSSVKIRLNSRFSNIAAVACTVYRRVVVGTGDNRKVKFRLFDTCTTPAVMIPSVVSLRHPGRGGILSVLGIDGSTQIVFSAIRRLKSE